MDKYSSSHYHDIRLAELDKEVVEKSVEVLNGVLDEECKREIRMAYAEDKETWWAAEHFGWGMRIRNLLRAEVCYDECLPSRNWDDYYVPLIEVAVGIRNHK